MGAIAKRHYHSRGYSFLHQRRYCNSGFTAPGRRLSSFPRSRAYYYLTAAEPLQKGDAEPIAQADRQVHELAHVYCGNMRLQKALSSHMELIRWAQRTIVDKLTNAYEIALPEHIAIMEAVCRRDAEGAAKAMRTHLENSRDRLSANIDLSDLNPAN